MVGASFALAMLCKSENIRIIMVERHTPLGVDLQAAPDLRVSALNRATENWLTEIGGWSGIEAQRSHCYRHLSVWEKLASNHALANKNRVTFAAADSGVGYLGHFVENAVTQRALWDALQPFVDSERLVILSGGESVGALQAVEQSEQGTTLFFSGDDNTPPYEIQAACIVGADGGQSTVRTLLDIDVRRFAYAQQVLAVGVELEQAAGDETWQAFRPEGPVALLPMMSVQGRHYAVLIWYDSAAACVHRQGLSDDALLQAVRQHYPSQLPAIVRIYARAGFPIARMHASTYARGRAVLIGDAAHTINPLAGQGVNLGFQDARCLSQYLAHCDVNDAAQLSCAFERYEALRRPENALMMHAMDAFYFGFSNQHGPLKLLRNAVLGITARSPWLKREVLRHAIGVS